MEVKLDKQYPLPVSPDQAWALLCDLEATAACMPGAAITEQVSETSYKGAVKVKVGPASAQFGGTVDVIERSDAERRVVMRGKGADKGGSSASMDLTATIAADPANPAACVLVGSASVIVNGKFAQFGGRMMVSVSEMLLGQFVEQFSATAQSRAVPAAAAGADAGVAATPPPAPAPVRELDGLALVWGLIKGWFARLLGRRS
jgi:carbon monoxide dehydrogenase subunit G